MKLELQDEKQEGQGQNKWNEQGTVTCVLLLHFAMVSILNTIKILFLYMYVRACVTSSTPGT